jgi:hypothetical protein
MEDLFVMQDLKGGTAPPGGKNSAICSFPEEVWQQIATDLRVVCGIRFFKKALWWLIFQVTHFTTFYLV